MTLTTKQKEKINNNLNAFIANFESIRIERADYGGGFFCYVPADNPDYIQYCHNIDYLEGWLYGCVQAVNRKELTPKWKE